ncbi:MAG TPA: MFS transporter, partial [bacterium]|nr:MFS transporter [bacterium]
MDRRMLAMGALLMLFLGLIYAWSLFAAPLEQVFGWSRSQTAVTFSISMTTFCLGSIGSGLMLKKHPPARILLLSAALFLLGFFLASGMTSIWGLYLSYGVLCGLGVGLSYNAILATVPKWYPGRAGFVTGTLLMGMGLGSLILGTVVNRVMEVLMWATTFRILAVVFFLVFVLGSFNLSSPKKQEQAATGGREDYSLPEMLKTRDFWLIFIWATIASAVGLGIVSNASYMAQELGVTAVALPLVVGMVSVGNGVGRLIFGAATDKFGGKRAMALSNLVYATGLALAILASKKALLFLIAAGFVLIGVAFGAPSTVSA